MLYCIASKSISWSINAAGWRQTIVLFTGQWAPVINYHQLPLFTPCCSLLFTHTNTRNIVIYSTEKKHQVTLAACVSFVFRSNDVPRKNNTNPTRCFGVYGQPPSTTPRTFLVCPLFPNFLSLLPGGSGAATRPFLPRRAWPTETRLCFYPPRGPPRWGDMANRDSKNWLDTLIAMTPFFSSCALWKSAFPERAIKSIRR